MGILNSVLIGKGRKSAGNITTYNRLGVSCFRQKPTLSPSYKPTVAQRTQQSVFKFVKANTDASGLKMLIDIFNDVRPRSGKSQTKWNIFYQSFLPHLVAKKKEIYALQSHSESDARLFLGLAGTNSDVLTKGVLGSLAGATITKNGVSVPASALDSIIAKANAKLSPDATPFSTADLFISSIAVANGVNEFAMLPVSKATVVLSDSVYTISAPDFFGNIDLEYTSYVPILVAKANDDSIDFNSPRFAITAVSNNVAIPASPVFTASNPAIATGTSFTFQLPESEVIASGLVAADLIGAFCDTNVSGGSQTTGEVTAAVAADGNVTVTVTIADGSVDAATLDNANTMPFYSTIELTGLVWTINPAIALSGSI